MTLSRAKWPPTQCNQTNQADKLKAKDHRLFTITFSWTKNTHRVTWCKFVALQILHQSSWEKQSLKVNTTNPHSSSIYQNHILMTKTPGPKKNLHHFPNPSNPIPKAQTNKLRTPPARHRAIRRDPNRTHHVPTNPQCSHDASDAPRPTEQMQHQPGGATRWFRGFGGGGGGVALMI